MPELPEVETVRRQLAVHVEGRTVAAVEISDPRWCAPQPPEEVETALVGRTIEQLQRRGKYLIAVLSSGARLLLHLRMTGILLWDPKPDAPYERVRFWLDDEHQMAFCDPRRFGTGLVLHDADTAAAYLDARLGPEPFDPDFSTELLGSVLRGRSAPIKAVLLDQKRIAGIGNIYADEALFRAGIHPARPARMIKPAQLGPLREAILESLQAGIDSGGASIDDFRHLDGARGSFQDDFLVHRRERLPCPDCQRPVTKMVVAGRGTYVCETCQPAPRQLPRSARRGR